MKVAWGFNVVVIGFVSLFIAGTAFGVEVSIGPAAITLANCEGLEAHAKSVAIRMNLEK